LYYSCHERRVQIKIGLQVSKTFGLLRCLPGYLSGKALVEAENTKSFKMCLYRHGSLERPISWTSEGSLSFKKILGGLKPVKAYILRAFFFMSLFCCFCVISLFSFFFFLIRFLILNHPKIYSHVENRCWILFFFFFNAMLWNSSGFSFSFRTIGKIANMRLRQKPPVPCFSVLCTWKSYSSSYFWFVFMGCENTAYFTYSKISLTWLKKYNSLFSL